MWSQLQGLIRVRSQSKQMARTEKSEKVKALGGMKESIQTEECINMPIL